VSATHVPELVLTAAGYRELQAELERQRARRREVAARLRDAAEEAGDLGDNLDYLDALRDQEQVDARIVVLEARLAGATVLDRVADAAAHVGIGSWVTFEDVATGEESRYRLVNSPEANPAAGRLSIESPVGAALTGHAPGDVVDVTTPHGRRRLRVVAATTAR
jgi:transcription elongation factor GreA